MNCVKRRREHSVEIQLSKDELDCIREASTSSQFYVSASQSGDPNSSSSVRSRSSHASAASASRPPLASGTTPSPLARPSSSSASLLKQALANRITPLLQANPAGATDSPARNGTAKQRKDSDASSMDKSILTNPAWYRDQEGRTGFRPAGWEKGGKEAPEIKDLGPNKSNSVPSRLSSSKDVSNKLSPSKSAVPNLFCLGSNSDSMVASEYENATETLVVEETSKQQKAGTFPAEEQSRAQKSDGADRTDGTKATRSSAASGKSGSARKESAQNLEEGDSDTTLTGVTIVSAKKSASSNSKSRETGQPADVVGKRKDSLLVVKPSLSPSRQAPSKPQTSGKSVKSSSEKEKFSPSKVSGSKTAAKPVTDILDATGAHPGAKTTLRHTPSPPKSVSAPLGDRRDSSQSDLSKLSHKSVTFNDRVEINEIERLQRRRHSSPNSSSEEEADGAYDLDEHLQPLRRALRSPGSKVPTVRVERSESMARDLDPLLVSPTPSCSDVPEASPNPPESLSQETPRTASVSSLDLQAAFPRPEGMTEEEWRTMVQSIYVSEMVDDGRTLGRDVRLPDLDQDSLRSFYLENSLGPDVYQQLQDHLPESVVRAVRAELGLPPDSPYRAGGGQEPVSDWERLLVGSLTKLHAEDSDTGSYAISNTSSHPTSSRGTIVRSASGYLENPYQPPSIHYDASAEISPTEQAAKKRHISSSPHLVRPSTFHLGMEQSFGSQSTARIDSSIERSESGGGGTHRRSKIPSPTRVRSPMGSPGSSSSAGSMARQNFFAESPKQSSDRTRQDLTRIPSPTSTRSPFSSPRPDTGKTTNKIPLTASSPATSPTRQSRALPNSSIQQSYYDNVSPSNVLVTNVSVNLRPPSPSDTARKAVGVVTTRVVTHPMPSAPPASAFSTLQSTTSAVEKEEDEDRLRARFVRMYGNRKAPIVDSEGEEAPRDPKPSGERKQSYESILSTDSRESVVSAVSYRAENKLRRYFNY